MSKIINHILGEKHSFHFVHLKLHLVLYLIMSSVSNCINNNNTVIVVLHNYFILFTNYIENTQVKMSNLLPYNKFPKLKQNKYNQG